MLVFMGYCESLTKLMNWKQFTTLAKSQELTAELWIINKVNELKAIHNLHRF